MHIAGGLPQVVAEWKDREVDSLDTDRLPRIAQEVIDGRYEPLAQELRKAEDREFLFQLAIMPSILPVAALADLSGKSPQQLSDILQDWCGRRLLKKTNGTYQFEHEKKQDLARSTLRQVLNQQGKPTAREVYDFYLANVGFPDKSHPDAPAYWRFAAALRAWADLSVGEVRFLEQAVECRFSEKGRVRDVPKVRAIIPAPWATRFLLFHLAATSFPDTQQVVDSLFDNVLEDPERFRRPGNLAKGLVNVLVAYGKAERLGDFDRVLDELRQLQKARPEDADVAGQLANGLVNALFAYGNAERLADVERVLDELRQLQ